MPDTPNSPFWTPSRKKFWTIGAILILLTAAGVLTTFLLASRAGTEPRSAAKGELSAYLSDEHKAAFREGTRLEQKFPVTDPAGIAALLQNRIGTAISFEELFTGGGLKLLSAGPSSVPGDGQSVHLRLASLPGKPATEVQFSLFIKQYRQLPKLDDMTALTLPGRGLGDAPIVVWRKGGLIYYLVANSADGIAVLRQGLGTPEPKNPY